MNPFEQHNFEILIPKQHVIDDIQLSDYSLNSLGTLIYKEGLLRALSHCINISTSFPIISLNFEANDCFRFHLIQGEILRFFIVMQLKNRAVLTESALKEIETFYPKMRFSAQMMKNLDSVVNSKICLIYLEVVEIEFGDKCSNSGKIFE